jgi:glycosyltransferase involved in cell wall biosynthesis
MHILLVADGRSPITRCWIQGVLALDHQVTLVSTYPCEAVPGILAQHCLPVAFGGLAGSQAGRGETSRGMGETPVGPARSESLAADGGVGRQWISRARRVFLAGRYWLGPLTLGRYARVLHQILTEAKPDLVHALRIPFEGMLAAAAEPEAPLVITIWGNDLTLHGPTTPAMRAWTRRTLLRANGLLADTRRDLRLACQWGFAADRPQEVVPGNGGIDLEELNRVHSSHTDTFANLLPAGVPLVVNPRGLRPAYVRNDIFFQAIPLVQQRRKDVVFVCPSMQGQSEALKWMQRLHLGPNVRLLPYLPQAQLWELFQRAEISASISTHDGTPNTLLEAMACACFPVVGDLEALREWITPGVNGLVVEPGKPQALAEALLLALEHPELRARAAEINQQLVAERAEVGAIRVRLADFYQNIANV